jgi:Fur family peroxide stress response transcriptional regulator
LGIETDSTLRTTAKNIYACGDVVGLFLFVKKLLTNKNHSYIVFNMNKQAADIGKIFRNKCREANLKITPQRTIIFESLIDDKGHPSADMIFQRVRKVVEGYGRPKRFDPDVESHHHFQCVKCNKIIDFCDKALDAIEVPKDIKSRFTITGKKVVLEGLCDSCKR